MKLKGQARPGHEGPHKYQVESGASSHKQGEVSEGLEAKE